MSSWRAGVHMTDSLSGLQGDDDENGSPVHSTHTAAVAHEVVEDGGEFGTHLPKEKEGGRRCGEPCLGYA